MHRYTFLACFAATSLFAAPPDLSKITGRAELDAVIASSPDPLLKQAMEAQTARILAAIEQRPHVEEVARIVEGAWEG